MVGRPDATAVSALALQVTRPVWFATLDFANGPLRATTLPHNVQLVSADADLNGFEFQSLSAQVQDFGSVHNQEGGSETLVVSISGQIFPDTAVLNTVGDQANWQGRVAKFWQGMRNEAGAFTGNIWLYHSGWMSQVNIGGSGQQQFIQLHIEGYMAMFGRAAGRTYMDQTMIDASDLSPQLVSASGAPGSGTGAGWPVYGGIGGDKVPTVEPPA